MNDLIKALQILAKYTDEECITHCEHDVFSVVIDPDNVSEEDKTELSELGFFTGDPDGCGTPCFYSYKYGSC